MPHYEMPGKWPTQDGVPVVTQSMVSSFLQCPREVYYSTVCGLRPRVANKPVTRGSLLHGLLEAHEQGKSWREDLERRITEAQSDKYAGNVAEVADLCRRAMVTYEWLYKDDPLKPIATELTVERPLPFGALYRGRIDMVAEDRQGHIWLVDHKTTASPPGELYRVLAPQPYLYLWAVKDSPEYAELGVPQPTGFLYNYISIKGLSDPRLTVKGKLSRAVKPENTSYPIAKEWLLHNRMATEVMGRFLLSIEDDEEYSYVKDWLRQVAEQDYTKKMIRKRMIYGKEMMSRRLRSLFYTIRRMLEYDWGATIEVNSPSCSGWMCSYRDLVYADMVGGDSTLEQKAQYTTTEDPLDYYPNQNKQERKKG